MVSPEEITNGPESFGTGLLGAPNGPGRFQPIAVLVGAHCRLRWDAAAPPDRVCATLPLAVCFRVNPAGNVNQIATP
jgi:hypothetical protein